jgi:glycine/D-amino acid oxidase-like deaminating enzyme
VIVGGGIAGLSAAWWMMRNGFRDFVVLELEDEAGGNSRGGRNDVSAFPWAAHYVPVPDAGATLVRELFSELGVLRPDGSWDERHLCFSPQERVFVHGRWHEGLESAVVSRAGTEELRRFRARMDEMRATGEFTIPSVRGARPSALDALSMDEWLRREGFRTPELRWYAEYGTRDDYGALLADTSAWAGIHYHAARPAHETGPLTWPEGNAWIVARLLERVGAHVRTGMPVHRVARAGTGARVLAGDVEYAADAVVWAAPSFLAPRLVEGAPAVPFAYSPWLVANLTLDRMPAERDAGVAWDNVLVDSPALGYVDATHQSLRTHRERTVWTYYRALAHEPPAAARRRLLARPWREWVDEILADLGRAHPDLRRCVSRVDVMRLGHAMARPTPGFLASPARRALEAADGAVVYANADVSGFSLFEEAQQRGVAAAEKVLARLGGRRAVAPAAAG